MQIIYEDQDILAINKPAGVVVNQAKTFKGETVQAWIIDYLRGQEFRTGWEQLIPADFSDQFGTVEEIWQERQGIVHRLDKETSGILLLSKNPGSLVNLLAQFKQRLIQKTYLALVHGKFEQSEGKISAPIARGNKDRLRFAISPEGRTALTFYKVLGEYNEVAWTKLMDQWQTVKDEKELRQIKKQLKRAKDIHQQGFSLVEAMPKTGRTHQIRVHLASMQHPLVGDKIYSGKKRAKLDKLWCRRHFLHAAKIEFFKPSSMGKEKQVLEASLPEDLQKVLELI